jgi:hypothetical protein
MYSQIPFIQHPWDWRGALSLDNPDYETVPILT